MASPAGSGVRQPSACRPSHPLRRAWPDAPRSPGRRGQRGHRRSRYRLRLLSPLTRRSTMSDNPTRTKVAIIGSGNIGTDLMIKVLRHSRYLEMAAMVGIDPASDGLARAARLNVATTHDGVEGLIALPGFDDVD